MSGESWGADVFDRLYASDPDPWGFATSPYEAGKYRDTLALIDAIAPGRRFAHAAELGCSIGVFTTMLAPRCDTLIGIDAAQAAIDAARARCATLPHLRFACGLLPAAFPDGAFDLLVISELLYFLSPADIEQLAHAARRAASPDAVILLANWTGPTDTPHTGDAAATRFIAALQPAFAVAQAVRRDRYRLDILRGGAHRAPSDTPPPNTPPA